VQCVASIAVYCIMSWVMSRFSSVSQCAAAYCDELLCVAVCGGVAQVGASVADSRAGGKHVTENHSVLKHVGAHCNVQSGPVTRGVTEWCQRFRCVMVCLGWLKWVEARCSVLCVVMGRTLLLFAHALKRVPSKFKYTNIYDNRYVKRNTCVHKDKCI